MYQRIARKKYIIKALDIETHNDIVSIQKGETSMWLGCYIDENSEMDNPSSYFYSFEELFDRFEIDTNPKRSKGNQSRPVKNICVYIYNLSFEYSFFINTLIARGFECKDHIEKDDEYCFSSVSTKSCSSVWQVMVKFSRKGGVVLFRDLAKLFGGGLSNVAKSFKLETQKGEIDYRKNRLDPNYVITKEEKEYCFKDTRILMEILMKMSEKEDKDFWNAVSMASYSMRKLLKRGWPRSLKPYMEFRKMYPELDEEETNFLRQSVGGGITYATDKWQFIDINQRIGHIDLHQAHPSSAFFKLFPFGKGEYFTGKAPLGRICCCRIRISYDYVKLHSVIKLIGLPFIEDKEIVVWDFEIPVMYKCYVNLRVEYIDGYAYKMSPLKWRRYYADNYNFRLEAKKNKDAFNILYYKLLNNSSYGKLLEKPHNQFYKNIIRPDGVIDSEVIDKNVKEINARYTYLPVGSCIPAYTRRTLIEGALALGWENVIYFDTDSIFFIWNKETEEAWSKFNQEDFLGGWGWEEFIDRAQFTAPKRYKLESEGKTTIKAGGINFDEYIKRVHKGEFDEIYDPEEMTEKEAISQINIPYDEINIVSSSWKVQRAYRVKGGTIIEFQDKDMKIPKKYLPIYEKNVK